MTRNQPGGQPSEGYQYGNTYGGYEGQQSYSDQPQYPGNNNPSDRNRGYNDYSEYAPPPGPPPGHYGNDAPTYGGGAQSYSAPNNQPYQPYSHDQPPPPVPYGSRPHDSRPYEDDSRAPYPHNPYSSPGPHPGQGGPFDHSSGNPDYSSPNAPGYPQGPEGESGERGFAGALAGGAAGAYGGHKVHHGFLGTVGGAIAGSMAENAYKKHSAEKKEHQHEEEERRRREEEERRRMQYAAPQGPPPGYGGGGYGGPGPMAGNFSASSRSMRLDRTKLRAECAAVDGRHRSAELELNDCLTNSNGTIHWARGGNFGGSCRGLRLVEDGSVLEAEAADGSGGWRHNRVWLNERITNEDGRLKMID